MSKGLKTLSSVLAAGLAAAAACAPIASADVTSPPTWNCRASVLYAQQVLLNFSPVNLIDPLAANGSSDPANLDNAFCANDSLALRNLNPLPSSSPIQVSLDELDAATVIDPQTGSPKNQTATASTTAAHAILNVGNGALVVNANITPTLAKGHCLGDTPELTSTGDTVTLTINGTAVPLNTAIAQIASALQPLNKLVDIKTNVEEKTGDATTDTQSITRTALQIDLLDATGLNPTIRIVLGQSKVIRQGMTCTVGEQQAPPVPGQNPPNTPPGTNGGPSGPTTPSVVFVPIQVPVNTGASSSNAKVQVNGTNGGCGTVRMFFDKNRRKTFSSRFGTRVVTRGRLISCSGKPIIGGRVDVFHQIRGSKHRLRKTGIRSRGGGLVTLILPLNITSRKIFFEYRGNLASSHVNSRSTLTITVRDDRGRIVTKQPPGQPKPHF